MREGRKLATGYRLQAASLVVVLVILGCSCSGKSESGVKFQQYYVQGEVLYKKHCSNCHQANGMGLGLVYPPLNKSDYMKNNFEQALCLMKHGIDKEITVNGKSYVQPMPGIPSLTDLEIAEIATYIYNSWDNQRGLVDVAEVSKVMSQCK